MRRIASHSRFFVARFFRGHSRLFVTKKDFSYE